MKEDNKGREEEEMKKKEKQQEKKEEKDVAKEEEKKEPKAEQEVIQISPGKQTGEKRFSSLLSTPAKVEKEKASNSTQHKQLLLSKPQKGAQSKIIKAAAKSDNFR